MTYRAAKNHDTDRQQGPLHVRNEPHMLSNWSPDHCYLQLKCGYKALQEQKTERTIPFFDELMVICLLGLCKTGYIKQLQPEQQRNTYRLPH